MVSLKAFSITLKLREYFSPHLMFTPWVLSPFSTKQTYSHEAKPGQVSVMRLVSKKLDRWIRCEKLYSANQSHFRNLFFASRE